MKTRPFVVNSLRKSALCSFWLVGFALLIARSGHAQTGIITWGDSSFGQTNIPPGLTNVVAIAAGYRHVLALRNNGRVVAWGDNFSGQTNVPSSVTNAMAISAGDSHSLAVRSNGTVIGWGLNTSGQATSPTGLSNVVAVSAGRNHSMALRANGTVIAWGENFDGQTNVPPGLTNVVAISAGDTHCLALRANGTVVAWGDNDSSQTNTPASLTNVMAIAAGYHHNLAVRSNGTVVGWTLNVFGETAIPPDLSGAVAVAGGHFFSTALRSNGTVIAWGKDFSGETNVTFGLKKVFAIDTGSDFGVALGNFLAAPPFVPDNFSQRLPIAGTNIDLLVSNEGATVEFGPDEPYHSTLTGQANSSVWLTWTAPSSGAAVITANADFYAPVIAVYTGSSLGALTRVVDNLGGFGFGLLVFTATAGTTYQIALDGDGSGAIWTHLELRPPPSNDAFANRTPITGFFFETAGSFIGATKEAGEPTHAGSNGDPSFQQTRWWSWMAPTNLNLTNIPVRLISDAVSFPPNNGIYTGTAISNLASVTSNSQTNGMTRVTTFTATAGTTYQIALSGRQYDPSSNSVSVRYGDFRMRLNLRALALSISNLMVTNNGSGTGVTSFAATAQVTNFGSATSNPLRVRVSAVPGLSVRGPDAGLTFNTNYTLYTTNLIALVPGQGRNARIVGQLPAPTEDPFNTIGTGYGAYAELEEQAGTNWIAVDQTIVVFGDWPALGGAFAGPGGGVVRLDPGLGGAPFLPLTNVTVVGPATVPENSTANYRGVATFSGGYTLGFSNTVWTASLFSISSNGVFTAGNVNSDTTVTLKAQYSSMGVLFEAPTNVTVLNVGSPAPPQLGQAQRSNNFLVFRVQGVANRKYALDTATNLASPTLWVPLVTNTLDANGLWNVVEPLGAAPRRFYRARAAE